MDTKLKSGNRALWLGSFMVTLVSLLFVSLFPIFHRNAAQFIKSYGYTYRLSEMQNEEYIRMLVRSNYVLYKNVMDKSGSTIFTYDDLYLEETISDVKEQGSVLGAAEAYADEEEYSWNYGQEVDAEQINAILDLYASQLQGEAADIQNTFAEEIGTKIDYYVLDKSTGTSLSNTSLPIADLLQKKDEDQEKDGANAYIYYVIMDYNESGYLQNISVRGRDADSLLKTVQVVENSSVGRMLSSREEVETFLFYDEEEGVITRKLSVSQRKPVNATFIYAVTESQISNVSTIMGYYDGVYASFFFLAAVMFAVVILLAFSKKTLLAGRRERRVPFEAVAVAACFLYGCCLQIIPELVMFVAEGEMRDWLGGLWILEEAPGYLKDGIGAVFSFCVVFILFGIWYVCCLEVSDVFRDGKAYFKNRILVCVLCRKIWHTLQKGYQKLKAEAAEADLGKDMNKLLKKIIFINFCLIETACLLWGFGMLALIFYFLILYFVCRKSLYKVQEQYGKLLEAANSIAQGRLNNTFEEDFGIFESYKEELYKIQGGFQNAVDEEVKSQRMKTELITNVSHDLKTPLTAIITYIDLLKEENVTEEQRKEYLNTLERKSLRLKILIEDLFEVSKANSGNVKLERVPVDICNLMRQAYLEQEDKIQMAGLQVRFIVPDQKVILHLDSQKTYRIFENLYTNIVKYALSDTRVFIILEKRETQEGEGVHIELKNISAQEIAINPQELTERFVRGDASRNTEGSGLGLAIARSFTELQGGSFRIETDGDLFKVVIDW